ncbi:MAG: serine/threonine-protein kinase, partial [Planctomycetota bacterium]
MSEREIFEAAIQIADQADRDRFVEKACGGNATLRAKVEELLKLAAQKTTDLLPPAGGSPEPKAASPGGGSSRTSKSADPLIGQSIGGVKLVRVISEGGMGRVYEGRQESPRRTVAVKLVKPGVATEKMLKRFEFEAQVLARLRHPGIAEIFYAGTFGEGEATQPFFVMEYIAGAKPLTRYADELKLSTHDRLELFRKVCDAVAHGHHNGVIHRDLKPSNILVDATGQPKVIDFGVAKTTDSDMALTTLQTDVGALIGTYQYMSPE